MDARRTAHLREYTIDQVQTHNRVEDNWVVIHGEVFNITGYLEDHPGGIDVLAAVAGTDATLAYEEIGHSDDAAEIMRPFLVGSIKGTNQPVGSATVKLAAEDLKKTPSSSTSTIVSTAVSIASTTASKSAMIVAVGLGAAAVVAFSRLNSEDLIKLFTTFHTASLLQTPEAGFLAGFVTATVIYIVCSFFVVSRVTQRLLRVESGFAHYPPYIQAK